MARKTAEVPAPLHLQLFVMSTRIPTIIGWDCMRNAWNIASNMIYQSLQAVPWEWPLQILFAVNNALGIFVDVLFLDGWF